MEGSLEHFNHPMNDLRKEVLGWMRYYGQLNNLFRALEEDPDGLFPLGEARLLRLLEQRTGRLREEAQLLREYCLQVRELFQAEIDIRQNRIMKILTIVTTIFLPLSLVAGWYGMNFVGMPELGWKYGYPAVIIVSVLVVLISLWIMKKKKFLVRKENAAWEHSALPGGCLSFVSAFPRRAEQNHEAKRSFAGSSLPSFLSRKLVNS